MKRDKIVTEEQRRKTAEMTEQYGGLSKQLNEKDAEIIADAVDLRTIKTLSKFKEEIIKLLDAKLGTSEKMIKKVYRHGIYIWVLAGLYILNLIMLFLVWFKI